METMQTVLNGLNELPAQPLVVQKLDSLLSEEEINNREVARLIETDQSLTARMLKLVNSPFYGYPRQIASVDEAITMLGLNAVHQLVLTSSLFAVFNINDETIDIRKFWKHSFGVGVIAKHLLYTTDSDTQDEAFISGILHDIGQLVLVKTVPQSFASFYSNESTFTDLEKEREYFGVDHQDLGEMLAQKWNFPKNIVTAIANHHTPTATNECNHLVAAVNIGDMLSHALSIGHSSSLFVSEFFPEAWQCLNLKMEKLDRILRQALKEIAESERILGDLK